MKDLDIWIQVLAILVALLALALVIVGLLLDILFRIDPSILFYIALGLLFVGAAICTGGILGLYEQKEK